MKRLYHFALLTGFLIAFPILAWAQSSKAPTFACGTSPGCSTKTAEEALDHSPTVDRVQDSLRVKAEAIAQKAASYREEQTYENLTIASRLFRESAQIFAAAHLYDEAANANIQAGETLVISSRYENARRFFLDALRLGRDPELRCRALSNVARTYASPGPYSAADSYSRQALNVCEPLSNRAQANALEARGEVLSISGGKNAKSVPFFRRAIQILSEANDNNGLAQAHLWLAYALSQVGQRSQALQAAGQALRIWTLENNTSGIAQAHEALGVFAVSTGAFETAECNYVIARPLFRKIGDKGNEASVLNGMGWASGEFGDWQKALTYYRRAAAAFASNHDLIGEFGANQGIGTAMAGMKNYSQLMPIYTAGLILARQTGNPVSVAASLTDMAGAYEARKQYADAETFYRRSLEANRAVNFLDGQSDALFRFGRLQAKQGMYSQAIASLEEANKLMETTGMFVGVAEIQYELAYIYRRLNRLTDARSSIEKSIAFIENQRVTIAQFDSRALYFASVHKYYALYIEVLMLLHYQQPEGGFAELAFEASERSKVRSLIDLLTTSAQDAPCDELLQRQLDPMADTRQPPTPLTPQTMTFPQVKTEIQGDDTALLEFALADEHSYAWVINKGQLTSYELPRAEQLRRLVEDFRGTLAPPQLNVGESVSEYQERLHKIERTNHVYAQKLAISILGPIRSVHSKRLLIVPDGSLQYIPFAALPLPGLDRNKAFLIDHFELIVSPSVSVLGSLRKEGAKKPPPTATAAIFADPVFQLDDPRVLTSHELSKKGMQERPPAFGRSTSDLPGTVDFLRLPASRDEANAIARILRSRNPEAVHVALDFDANRNYIMADGLKRFRLIHFATHGIVNSSHPEMSGLILSLIDRRGRKQDGYLRLGDIYQLKLSADLVVLSSCESALGKNLESEGIIGLPRGFLYAGAKGVIASLWRVSDEATSGLMASLYTRIWQGESPSSALRAAQLEMLHGGRWAKPYYWAAFVLQGDYR